LIIKALQFIFTMPRIFKQSLMLFFDISCVIGVFYLSFIIRLGYIYLPSDRLLLVILISPLLAIPIFVYFKFYQSIIRYIGFKALWSFGKAITFYSIIWALLEFIFPIDSLPRSIVIINWLLLIMLIGGSRIFVRWIMTTEIFPKINQKNVIIYGAGETGIELLNVLLQSSEYKHICFIDNDQDKQGTYINGFEVRSPDRIKDLIDDFNIQEILLAISSISLKHRKKMIDTLSSLPVNVRSLPNLTKLAQGKVKIEDLLDISVEDLLGRNTVRPNKQLLKLKITNKVVLVTGAGGSIGSELCRQIISLNPKILVLFEISEFFLYQIENELTNTNKSEIPIIPILGSIRDKSRFESILNCFNVQTIYHAAAYKHVPMVEYNNSEGVLNNIISTQIIAEASIAAGVETFVFISTDKAVRPTNTMGATKRAAELVLQALSKNTQTLFTIVRFGNVLNSSGSVIPLFKKQINDGGPITLTDPDIVRYFMTISEAVELVIQAGSMGGGGEVFVLDMGEPIRIYDLAVKMIQLSGLILIDENNPEGDIEINIIGLRPGEKLYEELLVDNNTLKTENPLIMKAQEPFLNWKTLQPVLIELIDAVENLDQKRIRKLLIKIVPEFKPQSEIVDFLN
jgi:FlaA1/EpsC-like NDP-sugar epimerase